MMMTPRPKHLPPVEGFDEEEALAESSPDAMLDSMGNPFEKLAGRPPPPKPGEEDPIGPAIGGMKALGPADKGDLDSAITGTLAKQPPPPPPGSQMPSGGAPPSMPAPMSRHYDDEQSDKRDVQSGRERDDQNRMLRGLEMAGRQLVGGVLQQPVAESVGQQTNYEQEATARAQRNRETRRTGDIDERNYTDTKNQRAITLAHQKWSEDEANSKANYGKGEDKRKAGEHDEDQEIEKNKSAATLKLAEASLATTRGEHEYKHDKDKTDDARALVKGMPAGWELTGETVPSDKQKTDFEGLVTSGTKMKGLTSRMRALLSKASTTDRVLPTELHNQLAQVAKQIMVESKNIAELGALSGPDTAIVDAIATDPTQIKNVLKDASGLTAGLDAWADNSVASKSQSIGAKRKTAGGAGASAPTKTTATNPKTGEKVHWNGTAWEPAK